MTTRANDIASLLSNNNGGIDSSSLPSNIVYKDSSTGAVTTPDNPAFIASHDKDTSAIGGTGDIVWNHVGINIGGYYNNTNGRFTAPVTGLYYFTAHTLVSHTSAGHFAMVFYKNSAKYLGSEFVQQKVANTWRSIKANAHIYMNANDFVTVRIGQHIGEGGALHNDPAFNQFSGHLVG